MSGFAELGDLLYEMRLSLLIEPGYDDEPMLLIAEDFKRNRVAFVQNEDNDLAAAARQMVASLESRR